VLQVQLKVRLAFLSVVVFLLGFADCSLFSPHLSSTSNIILSEVPFGT